jgi:hypothetical protein
VLGEAALRPGIDLDCTRGGAVSVGALAGDTEAATLEPVK